MHINILVLGVDLAGIWMHLDPHLGATHLHHDDHLLLCWLVLGFGEWRDLGCEMEEREGGEAFF